MPEGTTAPVTGPLSLFNTSATGQVRRLLSSPPGGARINQSVIGPQADRQHLLSADFIRWVSYNRKRCWSVILLRRGFV